MQSSYESCKIVSELLTVELAKAAAGDDDDAVNEGCDEDAARDDLANGSRVCCLARFW